MSDPPVVKPEDIPIPDWESVEDPTQDRTEQEVEDDGREG